jgi:hypothetical protein
MNKGILAFALALTILPVTALAQQNAPAGPPDLTPAQQQALKTTFQAFRQQEEQLHTQFRTQVLASISPIHRKVVAEEIGQLAISANPNPELVAKQIDSLLSPSERQAILNAHSSLKTAAKALHEKMKAQIESQMPAGMPHHDHSSMSKQHMQYNPDAGTIVLMTLGGGEHGGMDHGMGMWGHGPPH